MTHTTTTVYHLGTDRQLIFNLSPADAVIAAFELNRGNANTWTWAKPADHPQYFRGVSGGHHCGDFSATDR